MPPPLAATEPKPAGVLGLIAMGLAVLVGFAGAVFATQSQNGPQAEEAGFFIGSLLAALGIPFLIAYLIAGRKKSRNRRLLAWIFFGLVLLFSANSLLGKLGSLKPESGEQMAGRIMREAAGLQPVHHSMFSGRRKLEDALRTQFSKMVQVNKDYASQVGALDNHAIKDLNSAKSFVQPEVGDMALKQIHTLYEIDVTQEQKLEQIIADLRHALDATASSNAEREELEKAFDKGMQESMNRRSTTIASEKAWLDSLDDEYQYARAHQTSLRQENGQVVIQGHDILLEFNRRFDRQNVQRKDFIKRQKEFSDFQAETLKKVGLTPQDVGRK